MKRVKSVSSLKGEIYDKLGNRLVAAPAPPQKKPLPEPKTPDYGRSAVQEISRVADALNKLQPPPPAAVPDYSPMLQSIEKAVTALAARPDHKRWVFQIKRDQSGEIASVVATAGPPKKAEA